MKKNLKKILAASAFLMIGTIGFSYIDTGKTKEQLLHKLGKDSIVALKQGDDKYIFCYPETARGEGKEKGDYCMAEFKKRDSSSKFKIYISKNSKITSHYRSKGGSLESKDLNPGNSDYDVISITPY